MEPASQIRFDFPFQPYPAQQLLMTALYETASHGTHRAEDGLAGAAVGIFESPTGTGKSLSIICSLLKWLEEQEQAMMNPQPKSQAKSGTAGGSSSAASADGFPDWLMAFTVESDSTKKARAMEFAHRTVSQRISAAKAASNRDASTHRELVHVVAAKAAGTSAAAKQAAFKDADDIDCLDEYHSDDESAGGSRWEVDPEASSDDEEELDLPQQLEFPKILYSSRTHSQLSQFMTEIRKTRYSHVRCITVSSRRNLCINPEVYTLESDLKLNERCLELLRNQQKAKRTDTNQPVKRSRGKDAETSKESSSCGSGCPYYSSRDALRFRDHALAEIRDVEELASLGRKMHTCPYYGMRKSIEWAQVVAMPYSVLLQPQARSAVGVDVRGNIVVVDEAHNLIEAINELHSVQLTVAQIRVAQRQLSEYLDRFKLKLAGKNLYYVNVLLTILQSLIRYVTEPSEDDVADTTSAPRVGATTKAGNSDEIFRISDFMFRTRLEHANLFKVGRFIVRSEIARKVCSYFDRKAQAGGAGAAAAAAAAAAAGKEDDVVGSRFAVQDVARFLSAVTSRDVQGRVVVRRRASAPETGMYRFVVLDSKAYFDDIIRDARAVILVGGTMQPFDHVRSHLFPDVGGDRLRTFACDHVIPAEQVKAIALCCGPNRREFDFRLSNRNDSAQLEQLAAALLQIRSSLPHGIVCFFASYSYMDAVLAKLEAAGQLEELRSRTAVFHEPRHAKDLEKLLARYAEQAVSDRGAIIFCVVGGKLSEGINFSDDLARAVVVVGLPYPDMRDIELQQRMQQLDRRRNGWGREYYESLCMRAVNQSIGRSIRHANDYAAIILIDARYRQQRIQSQLPQWVRRSLRTVDRFPELAEQLDAFRQYIYNRR